MLRFFLAPSSLILVLCATASVNAQVPENVVLNHYDFVRVFVPTAGRHHVVIIHPGSGAPVKVSFTLPCGRPDIRVYPRRIIFDYGYEEVEIHFALCGFVQVHTRPLSL
jgi:hypothetical protein